MAQRTIDELAQDARRGNPEAIAALCRDVYPKLLKYMRYRVDAVSADDLTNEVFLRVLRGLPGQTGSFVAWLYRIAANVVVDHHRSKAARKEAPMNDASEKPAVAVAGGQPAVGRRLDLAEAVARLTDDQRELVTLKFMQGLSNAEVAEITGRTPEAVRALQFRALMALREILDAEAQGDRHADAN